MTLRQHLNDREWDKFADISGETVVRVFDVGSGMATTPFVPQSYDEVSVSYPTPETEVYEFKLLTILKGTITLTYLDSSKNKLLSAVRT